MSKEESVVDLEKGFPLDDSPWVSVKVDDVNTVVEEAEEAVECEAKNLKQDTDFSVAMYVFFIFLITWALGFLFVIQGSRQHDALNYPGIIVSCGTFLGVIVIQASTTN